MAYRSSDSETLANLFQRNVPKCHSYIGLYRDFVEVPSSLVLQSEVFSSYKNHTTWKGKFGITPAGAVSFVSALYCGSSMHFKIFMYGEKENGEFLQVLPFSSKICQ